MATVDELVQHGEYAHAIKTIEEAELKVVHRVSFPLENMHCTLWQPACWLGVPLCLNLSTSVQHHKRQLASTCGVLMCTRHCELSPLLARRLVVRNMPAM